MAELKPCPFCGGEAAVIDNGCFVDVSCKNFHCRGWADSLMFKSKEEAIEAWNRRAVDTPCDLCRFNPPSSGDGKPCTMCVAEGRAEDGK
jgi:Lar family restriction alleviation protein